MLRKKSRGSDPDNSYISYIVLCDGRYLGRIFYTDAGVPKDAAGFGVSNFTSGKDARCRSKTTLRTEAAMRSGNVGEPTGRANLVAKSPAVANGRAAHASVLVFICGADSYSTTCGGSGLLFGNLVGVAGFEPATPSSRTRCVTARALKIQRFS